MPIIRAETMAAPAANSYRVRTWPNITTARIKPERTSNNNNVQDSEDDIDPSPRRYKTIGITVQTTPMYDAEYQPASAMLRLNGFNFPRMKAAGVRKTVMANTTARALPVFTALTRLLRTMNNA